MRTRLFIAALCAAAGFTACNIAPEQPELTEYTLTVEASMPEPDTKGLALDGTKLNAVWTSDDQVIVLDGTTQVGTLTPQSTGSATAVLKGTLTQSVSVGKALTLQTPRKSWAYNSNQDGTLSSVSSKLAYARAGITVTAVNGSEISAGTAHFENQQAIVKFTLKNDKGSILTVDKLTVEAASKKLVRTLGAAASYGSIAINNPGKARSLYAALRNDSGAADTYTLTATIGNDVYHCTKSGVLLENGKYYNVTATISEEVHTYTIVGAPIFGSTWNREESSNDLVKQGSIYKSKVYKVTNDPTSVEFKIVKDHDYSNGEWPASNYTDRKSVV